MKKWFSKKVSAIVLAIAGLGMVLSSLSFDWNPTQKETGFATARTFVSEHAQANSSVLAGFDAFAKTLEKAHAQKKISDIHKILEAVDFAAEKNRFSLGAAEHLMTVGGVYDPNIIIGALLQGTVDGTDTTFADIQKKFGSEVAKLVRETTDDNTLPAEQREELQISNAPHMSQGAAEINLSDKWYNMNLLATNPPSGMSKERIDQYYLWSEEVVNKLPKVNAPLKDSVDKLIKSYWVVREVPIVSKSTTLPSSNS